MTATPIACSTFSFFCVISKTYDKGQTSLSWSHHICTMLRARHLQDGLRWKGGILAFGPLKPGWA